MNAPFRFSFLGVGYVLRGCGDFYPLPPSPPLPSLFLIVFNFIGIKLNYFSFSSVSSLKTSNILHVRQWDTYGK